LIYHIIDRILYYDNLYVSKISIENKMQWNQGFGYIEVNSFSFKLSKTKRIWMDFDWSVEIIPPTNGTRDINRVFRSDN
jgi:hypothetical protein